MIDAALLATDYSQQDPLVGSAEDSPADATIVCYLETVADGSFFVRVGISEGNVARGQEKAKRKSSGFHRMNWPSVLVTQRC